MPEYIGSSKSSLGPINEKTMPWLLREMTVWPFVSLHNELLDLMGEERTKRAYSPLMVWVTSVSGEDITFRRAHP